MIYCKCLRILLENIDTCVYLHPCPMFLICPGNLGFQRYFQLYGHRVILSFIFKAKAVSKACTHATTLSYSTQTYFVVLEFCHISSPAGICGASNASKGSFLFSFCDRFRGAFSVVSSRMPYKESSQTGSLTEWKFESQTVFLFSNQGY